MTYQPEHLCKWTMPDNYFGASWPDYFGAGVGRSRDSQALERSNFVCMLEALGGESETVKVIREGHWAVGWVEWVAIHQDDERSLRIADDLAAGLEDYPIINEEHFSAEEDEEAQEVWRECFGPIERIEYIRRWRDQFDFSDFKDLVACVRGEFFAGYASELLY